MRDREPNCVPSLPAAHDHRAVRAVTHGVFMGTQLERPEGQETISRMLKQAADGELVTVVDRAFPFAAAAQGHACTQGNSIVAQVVFEP